MTTTISWLAPSQRYSCPQPVLRTYVVHVPYLDHQFGCMGIQVAPSESGDADSTFCQLSLAI